MKESGKVIVKMISRLREALSYSQYILTFT